MFKSLSNAASSLPVIFFLAILPGPAAAYIGPGAGLGAFAVVLALGAGLLLLLVGLVWYPVKRMMKRKRIGQSENGSAERK